MYEPMTQSMIENLHCGYGQRVDASEAEPLWEAWSVQFRTNAFRRVRPTQWVTRTGSNLGGGVELHSSHPAGRIWIAVCVWKGQPECFVHRPAFGVTYRMCPWLKDDAWSEPRLFVAEMTEAGEVWIEDVSDRRLGDWARRLTWCQEWIASVAPDAGWRVKTWKPAGAVDGLQLLDSPLDGNRVLAAVREHRTGIRATHTTVWKPQEDCEVGVIRTPEGTWVMPRFPDIAVYRDACGRTDDAACTCVWNDRMRCWDLEAFSTLVL